MSVVKITSKEFARVSWGYFGAFVAGLAFITSGLLQFALVYPASGPGELGSASAYLIESAHTIGWFGMILAFFGLRAIHRQRFGLFGNVGIFLSVVSNLLMISITIAVLVSTASLGIAEANAIFAPGTIGETIANVFAIPGFLSMFVWIPLIGIATWRGKVMPRWGAALLIAHPLAFFFLLAAYGAGGIGLGVLWLMIGITMIRLRMPSQ